MRAVGYSPNGRDNALLIVDGGCPANEWKCKSLLKPRAVICALCGHLRPRWGGGVGKVVAIEADGAFVLGLLRKTAQQETTACTGRDAVDRVEDGKREGR